MVYREYIRLFIHGRVGNTLSQKTPLDQNWLATYAGHARYDTQGNVIPPHCGCTRAGWSGGPMADLYEPRADIVSGQYKEALLWLDEMDEIG